VKKMANFVVFENTLNPLLSAKLDKSTPPEIKDPTSNKTIKLFILEGKCNVQSILVAAINDILKEAYQRLETDHIIAFLDCLYVSYTFANEANNHQILIEILSNKKTILEKLLVRKEHDGLTSYLTILNKLYTEKEKDAERRKQVGELRIISPCKLFLEDVAFEKALKELSPPKQEYRKSKLTVLVQILQIISSFTDEQFLVHARQFYKPLTDLLLSDAIEYEEIRLGIHKLLLKSGFLFSIIKRDNN